MKTAKEILLKHKSRRNQFVSYTDDSDCINAMEEYASQFKPVTENERSVDEGEKECLHRWMRYSGNEFEKCLICGKERKA